MQREIELELPCDLNDEDVTERALSMSATLTEIDEVQNNKREAMKAYNERLQFLEGRVRALGQAVSSRGERRIVKCIVTYHKPIAGIKRTVRLDTGELVKEEPMSDAEKQKHLFDENAELERIAQLNMEPGSSGDCAEGEAAAADEAQL